MVETDGGEIAAKRRLDLEGVTAVDGQSVTPTKVPLLDGKNMELDQGPLSLIPVEGEGKDRVKRSKKSGDLSNSSLGSAGSHDGPVRSQ